SWLAPLFRAFTRPLRADAGTIEQAPKVDVTLANDLGAMPEKSLLSDPWLNMSRPPVDLHDDQLLVARAAAAGSGTISISTLSASAAAQSIASIPPTYVFSPPRNDSAARLPIIGQGFSSAPTAAPSSSAATF